MLDSDQIETRYAKSGELNIAYQVFGSGDVNLVLIPGWASHVENIWTLREFAQCAEQLAQFARVILLDRRGTGLSDPVTNPPTLEAGPVELLRAGRRKVASLPWAQARYGGRWTVRRVRWTGTCCALRCRTCKSGAIAGPATTGRRAHWGMQGAWRQVQRNGRAPGRARGFGCAGRSGARLANREGSGDWVRHSFPGHRAACAQGRVRRVAPFRRGERIGTWSIAPRSYCRRRDNHPQ